MSASFCFLEPQSIVSQLVQNELTVGQDPAFPEAGRGRGVCGGGGSGLLVMAGFKVATFSKGHSLWSGLLYKL